MNTHIASVPIIAAVLFVAAYALDGRVEARVGEGVTAYGAASGAVPTAARSLPDGHPPLLSGRAALPEGHPPVLSRHPALPEGHPPVPFSHPALPGSRRALPDGHPRCPARGPARPVTEPTGLISI